MKRNVSMPKQRNQNIGRELVIPHQLHCQATLLWLQTSDQKGTRTEYMQECEKGSK